MPSVITAWDLPMFPLVILHRDSRSASMCRPCDWRGSTKVIHSRSAAACVVISCQVPIDVQASARRRAADAGAILDVPIIRSPPPSSPHPYYMGSEPSMDHNKSHQRERESIIIGIRRRNSKHSGCRILGALLQRRSPCNFHTAIQLLSWPSTCTVKWMLIQCSRVHSWHPRNQCSNRRNIFPFTARFWFVIGADGARKNS